eukprot:scaffold74204_cov27-Tisochrysis_lutea.AAC.2
MKEVVGHPARAVHRALGASGSSADGPRELAVAVADGATLKAAVAAARAHRGWRTSGVWEGAQPPSIEHEVPYAERRGSNRIAPHLAHPAQRLHGLRAREGGDAGWTRSRVPAWLGTSLCGCAHLPVRADLASELEPRPRHPPKLLLVDDEGRGADWVRLAA